MKLRSTASPCVVGMETTAVDQRERAGAEEGIEAAQVRERGAHVERAAAVLPGVNCETFWGTWMMASLMLLMPSRSRSAASKW